MPYSRDKLFLDYFFFLILVHHAVHGMMYITIGLVNPSTEAMPCWRKHMTYWVFILRVLCLLSSVSVPWQLQSADWHCIFYRGFGDEVLNHWAFRLGLLCQNIYVDAREWKAKSFIELKTILKYMLKEKFGLTFTREKRKRGYSLDYSYSMF